jgi:polyvinyl alcohol dehydrogenase (cytochrome)
MFGQNVANTSATTTPGNSMSAKQIAKIKPKWILTTGGDVSARAAVVNGLVYFPDWGGNIWAVGAESGQVAWSHKLSDYGLAAGTVSRTSPTVVNGVVYIGTQYVTSGPTGWLLAINASTGALIWKVQPTTSNAFPVITGSPVVAGGNVYVPMTSNEEFAAAAGSTFYQCCSVSGSVVALNATTGAKLWETFTVPAGYSGGAVWGGNPVVDTARGTVFVGTGNNYSVPTDPAFVSCIADGGTRASCESPNDHADSILALDMYSGAVKWAVRLENWNQQFLGVTNGSDFWNVDCFVTFTNCPASPGPDYDFGSAPNEITYQTGNTTRTIIGAGQKSGIYYALDPDTGALLWQTQVGPGSSLGGMEWGSASDGTRIYVEIANLYGVPYTAFGLPASLGSAGSWAALDPATGKILWQVADPNGAVDLGPLAVASGVVYVGSMAGSATAPTMLALDASNGSTIWSYAAGSSVNAGATIVGENVYWGSGYTHLGIPGYTGNNKFYAFAK